ncbi:Yqey-like protein-domain-containing protein [Filobasidium floriforme]|uniref:Yqey-like protein-domain-containing protein n=1 Tax=Filobasidium floriforme TaxID=5210 RepID=UPI001E8DB3C9|nr:Yqey-like protein-domain-containing protein [Filobasidium floriforme]KAH8081205.1 Yqey-like protein-domain-containing protein [Filobasidium floriforme]
MLRTTTLRTTLPFTLTRNIQANVPPVQRFISTTSVLLNEQTLQEDIRSRLKAALKTAMKAKEKDTAGTIRAVMSDITYHEKSQSDPNAAASEDTVIDVLRRSVDKRIQASESYPADHPNRQTLSKEIEFISSFLPRTLEPSAITQILSGIVSGLKEEERQSKGVTGKVLERFWQGVTKGEVKDKKALGKEIGELLKKIQV